MKLVRTTLIILLVFAVAVGFAFAGGQQDKAAPAEKEAEEDTLKAACLMSGPINDGGWNQQAYEGMLRLRDNLGYEIAYTENVKKAEQKSILRNYAQKGFDLIFGHGFEYGDAINEVAPEFPEVTFYNIGGNAHAENAGSGQFAQGELSYLAGVLAAEFTKTNKLGFVGAMEIPTIKLEVETFKEVAKEYNPDTSVTVAYTGSWTDVNKGKEAALAQISQGVDVILAIGDACDVGAIQAAKDRDAYVIAFVGDFNHLAPETVLTSCIQDVAKLIELQGDKFKNGTWENERAAVYGIASGIEHLGKWSPLVPEDLKQKVLDLEQQIADGELNVTKSVQ